jgi:hypothetical protein
MPAQFVPPFVLTVDEIFHFEDGATIFAGAFTGEVKTVKACRVEVWLDGAHFADAEIAGERAPGPRLPPGFRILYTYTPLGIDKSISPKRFRLVHRAGKE